MISLGATTISLSKLRSDEILGTDWNQLLFDHQVALIDEKNAVSHEARQWAGSCADFYADRIDSFRARLPAHSTGTISMRSATGSSLMALRHPPTAAADRDKASQLSCSAT